MKTLPSGLAAHYAGSTTSLALLWKITRRDAQVFAFTDHDNPLTFGGTTYLPTSAFDPSAVLTRAEMNVDDMEVVGLLDSAGITEADIEAGKWDGAAVEVRRVNWANLGDGAEVLRVGEIGNIQRRGLRFVAELRGLMAKLQNNIGRLISPLCDAELGDARCGVNLAPWTHSGTVTAVASRRVFTAAALTQAAGYFAAGKITWATGANSGVAQDVRTNASGVVTLALPMALDIQVGDTFSIVAGCDKRHFVDRSSGAPVVSGDCKTRFANVVNFRGFPAVPGRDRQTQVGVA